MEQQDTGAAPSTPASPPSDAPPSATSPTSATSATSAQRRRRRRGGRGRGGANRSTTAAASDASDESTASDPAASGVDANGLVDRNAGPEAAAANGPGPRRTTEGSARRRPSTSGTSGNSSTDTDATLDPTVDADAGAGDEHRTAPSSGTRRRRRGGRGRGGSGGRSAPKTLTDSEVDALAADPDPEGAAVESPATQRDDATPDVAGAGDGRGDPAGATSPQGSRSRNRSRRRRSSTTGSKAAASNEDASTDAATAEDVDAEVGSPAGATASTAAKPRRPARRTERSVEEQIAAGGPTRGIRTTRSRTGRDGRRRREVTAPPPRVTDKLMVITEHGDRDQIAVLEEDALVQHYVTRVGATSMVGNIYLGRVQNVLPGMEAAFVDVGRGRNGVLYAGEVNYAPEDVEGPAPRIEQILKPGQSVMVQVTKDPMGGKGARLTANLSLAGRYLVLAPNQSLSGISRRLSDDARRTLKSILKRVKPDEHGVIVRTAAEGASEEAITADLQRLLRIWDDIQRQAKKKKAPTGLYEEPELTVRVVRDLFTDEEFRELVTDSPRVHEKVLDYVREIAPDLESKITLHTGPLPAFEQHRVVEQIHKALDRKVWLPSGGYLVIERTEAMTIVDVNTGKAVGKTNLEETVVNTNLEAAREVARQLRLRDIGGIIVVDFIDMLLEKNKKQVEDTMREALAIDKTRSQVFEIGPLGLMQVTRKRVSSGLVESFSETCPTCEGRGILLNYEID